MEEKWLLANNKYLFLFLSPLFSKVEFLNKRIADLQSQQEISITRFEDKIKA